VPQIRPEVIPVRTQRQIGLHGIVQLEFPACEVTNISRCPPTQTDNAFAAGLVEFQFQRDLLPFAEVDFGAAIACSILSPIFYDFLAIQIKPKTVIAFDSDFVLTVFRCY